MSKEQFKEFVKTKPELANYVINNEMTWQKFYELYDLYGEDETIWSKYTNESSKSVKPTKKIADYMEKFDPDSLQKHIENAQKALDIFSELATKTTENINNNIKPNIARPLSKFFGD